MRSPFLSFFFAAKPAPHPAPPLVRHAAPIPHVRTPFRCASLSLTFPFRRQQNVTAIVRHVLFAGKLPVAARLLDAARPRADAQQTAAKFSEFDRQSGNNIASVARASGAMSHVAARSIVGRPGAALVGRSIVGITARKGEETDARVETQSARQSARLAGLSARQNAKLGRLNAKLARQREKAGGARARRCRM